jgi:hypothetical protein
VTRGTLAPGWGVLDRRLSTRPGGQNDDIRLGSRYARVHRRPGDDYLGSFRSPTGVGEQLELQLHVTTKPEYGALEEFTTRYQEGSVLLLARNEGNDSPDDRPAVGALRQEDGALYIRLLVRPLYLAALASLFSHPGHLEAKLLVCMEEK